MNFKKTVQALISNLVKSSDTSTEWPTGPPAQQPLNKTDIAPVVHDRKCNIILDGMQECPKGTNGPTYINHDLEKATEMLASIEGSS